MTPRVRIAAAAAVLLAGTIHAAATTAAQNGVRDRFFVSSVAESLVAAGLARAAPADPAGFEPVPPPGIRNVPNDATATASPWIDSSGWRFAQGLRRARYATLPAGTAALAAAEAFTYGVEALLSPAAGDVDELGRMLRFLAEHDTPAGPVRANIGVVASDSPLLAEVLNMLTRRNLLFRVVTAPEPGLDLTVQLGSERFPLTAARDPSEFAARVRDALGDERRLVRVFGSNTVVARLFGDPSRARLLLLDFSRSRNVNNLQNLRVRVLGRYRPAAFAAFGAPAGAVLQDVRSFPDAIEFQLPLFTTMAIVDLTGR